MMEQVYNSSNASGWTVLSTGAISQTITYTQYPTLAEIKPENPSEVNQSIGDRISMEDRLYSDSWISLLRDELFAVHGIESIHIARDDTTLDVWVIIPERDIKVVRSIAETERAIMARFINHQRDPIFFFDFHTMYRESNQTNELVPLRAIEIPRN